MERMQSRNEAESICLCVTDNGCFGLIPGWCEVGDAVVYAPGARSPLILRSREDHWHFEGMALLDNPDIQRVDDPRSVRSWVDIQRTQRFDIR